MTFPAQFVDTACGVKMSEKPTSEKKVKILQILHTFL